MIRSRNLYPLLALLTLGLAAAAWPASKLEIDARVKTATRDHQTGLFLLRAVESAEIVVETDPPLTAVVPSAGGIRIG